jgi:regulator of sigma E protease
MLDGGHLALYTIEAVQAPPGQPAGAGMGIRGGLAFPSRVAASSPRFNDLGSFGLWERVGRLIG